MVISKTGNTCRGSFPALSSISHQGLSHHLPVHQQFLRRSPAQIMPVARCVVRKSAYSFPTSNSLAGSTSAMGTPLLPQTVFTQARLQCGNIEGIAATTVFRFFTSLDQPFIGILGPDSLHSFRQFDYVRQSIFNLALFIYFCPNSFLGPLSTWLF